MSLVSQPLSVLGCGGHGWLNCSELVANWQGKVYIWFATIDWGGFTGIWGRMCEADAGRVHHILHGTNAPVMPWGDIQKAIGYFLSASHTPKVSNLWLQRHTQFNSLRDSWQAWSVHINLSAQEKKDFENYLHTAWTHLSAYCTHTSADTPQNLSPWLGRGVALAHFFSPWLLQYTASMKQWNQWWHQHGILPNNTYLYFSHTHRAVLQAQDIYTTQLIGEDIIDEHPYPLHPQFFDLSHPAQLHPDILDILSASQIIIPTGSVANWLPLVHQPKLQSCLQKHTRNLTWIPNVTASAQDVSTYQYLQELHRSHLHPRILLAQQDDPFFHLPASDSVIPIRSQTYSAGIAPHRQDIADALIAQ